jgi:hypothetical protein
MRRIRTVFGMVEVRNPRWMPCRDCHPGMAVASIADHLIRSRSGVLETLPSIDTDIRAAKWRLWHDRVDRTIRDLERLVAALRHAQRDAKFSIARLHSLGLQLLTHVRSNRGTVVNYGKRYGAELRVATTLAEAAVNSLVAKRMVKKQQVGWSLHGAHMQVRTAELNRELRDRLWTRLAHSFDWLTRSIYK